MTLSKNRQEVFCHLHNECRGAWISIREGIYLDDNNILCLKDDAHLGYLWDLPEIFGVKNGKETLF